jgi:single-strand DNA-binding protein
MNTTNKVILIGYLGADPEGFLTKSSIQGAKFRIATNETWKDENGETKSITDWHRVVLFGKQAESVLEHLSKGRLVQVEGRLQTRSYNDRAGLKRSQTSVLADRVTLLDSPKAEAEAAKEEAEVVA